MQFYINSPNPDALLRGTLGVLAEKFGGYKDGNVFLGLFDDLIEDADPEIVNNALIEFRALVNKVRGATAAYALEEAENTTMVADEPEVTDEAADFAFVDATDADREAMTAPSEGPFIFTLPGGPEALFRPGSVYHADEYDFGPGNDLLKALFGQSGGVVAPPTAKERLNALSAPTQLALGIVYGPTLAGLPEDQLAEIVEVAEMTDALLNSKAA